MCFDILCNFCLTHLSFSEEFSKILSLMYIGLNTLATGYGDFRTSVASGRRRATEISVFTPTGGWKSGLVLLCFVMFCYVVIQP